MSGSTGSSGYTPFVLTGREIVRLAQPNSETTTGAIAALGGGGGGGTSAQLLASLNTLLASGLVPTSKQGTPGLWINGGVVMYS